MVEPRSTAAPDAIAIEQLTTLINNNDVRWDGTSFGLMPTVVSTAGQQLLASGAPAISHLIDSLDDESRFVVAHVLLTHLSGIEYQTIPWNGLNIELLDNGEVRFDTSQRFELQRRWQQWHRSSPHPRSLPK